MSPSDTNYFLLTWYQDYKKVFKWKNFLSAKGYDVVVIKYIKDNIFEGTQGGSYIFNKLTKDDIIKMLYSNSLEYIEDYFIGTNYIERYLTDGCQCGNWALKYSKKHSYWCPRYRED